MPKGIPQNGINEGWFKKGNIPWDKNKKLSKEHIQKISERVVTKETREKMSKSNIRRGAIPPSQLGKRPWNKDLSLSVEHKKNLSLSHTGLKQSESSKKKKSLWHIEHPNKKFKETGIELKTEEELNKRGINYQKQVPLCKTAVVDFYLPDYKIVIQTDGCYYHNCLIHYPNYHIDRRNRDIGQDIILKSNNYKIYRFWEHEINESVENCINRINEIKYE